MMGPPYLGPEIPEQEQQDDVTALARMLASEDRRSYGARVVIAWITYQKARRARKSLFSLLTDDDGYGPQVRDGKAYYAATTRPYRAEDKELAESVLNDRVKPSAVIRKYGIGGWVERGGQLSNQLGIELSPDQEDGLILEKQAKWGEGIYGRLEGTQWMMFSSKAPILQNSLVTKIQESKDEKDSLGISSTRAMLNLVSTRTLDAVPVIPALDSPQEVA